MVSFDFFSPLEPKYRFAKKVFIAKKSSFRKWDIHMYIWSGSIFKSSVELLMKIQLKYCFGETKVSFEKFWS